MIDNWIDIFNELNCWSEEGGQLAFDEEATDLLLFEALIDWLRDQITDLWPRFLASDVQFWPSGRGGINVQLDLEGVQFFPFLSIEIDKRGMIKVERVGQHADTVINTNLGSREPNKTLKLLVEEFL